MRALYIIRSMIAGCIVIGGGLGISIIVIIAVLYIMTMIGGMAR